MILLKKQDRLARGGVKEGGERQETNRVTESRWDWKQRKCGNTVGEKEGSRGLRVRLKAFTHGSVTNKRCKNVKMFRSQSEFCDTNMEQRNNKDKVGTEREGLKLYHGRFWMYFRMTAEQFKAFFYVVLQMLVPNLRRQSSSSRPTSPTD